jgi:hypothetical protein
METRSHKCMSQEMASDTVPSADVFNAELS